MSARKRAEWLNAVEKDWHRSLACRYTENYAGCAYRHASADTLTWTDTLFDQSRPCRGGLSHLKGRSNGPERDVRSPKAALLQ